MMNWSIIFYFSIISAALLLSAVGVWLTALLPGIDRWSKRFFLSYFVIFLLCCLSGLLEIILEQQGVPVELVCLVIQVECLSLSLPLLMLTVYLLHCSGDDLRSSPLLWAALGLEGFYCVILVLAPFSDCIFYFTADGQPYRGPLYPVFLLPIVAIMLLSLFGALRRRRRLSHKVFLGFLVAIVPTMLSLIVQLFVDVFALIDISYVLSALSMYSFVLSDQIEEDLRREREIAQQQRESAEHQREIARQEREISRQQRENAEHQREIARQRLSILVLQMRPHFIYNSLACIHSLIRHEPEKAQQVTADFTNYLRQNFNAVVSEQPIPFTAELKHTQTYLAVERAQHEQLLEVSFDTPFTRFRLPPLTLQPIAENAVKHGMNPYVGPLHVWIQTRREESATVITVEDNGPGFDPNDENTPHPSLDNIRMRLELMCEGTMEITPRENGGTVVRVWVPDKRPED